MKKKRSIPKQVEPLVSGESAYVETFSLDPDSCVVPTSVGLPSWVYTYEAALEQKCDEFLAKVDADEYNRGYMAGEVRTKHGVAKAAVQTQVIRKLYNVEEQRRAEEGKKVKLMGQRAMLEELLASYEKQLETLERTWDSCGLLM